MSYIKSIQDIVETENIKFISVDIFDTLIFRRCVSVENIWRQVAQKAFELGVYESDDFDFFISMRKLCEEEARKKKFKSEGHSEVSLEEIYQFWETINWKKIASLEVECEINNWILNDTLIEWLSLQKNKKIILISDMYLSSHFIINFINKNHSRLSISDVFVSCEHNCDKRGGKLFNVAIKKMKNKPCLFLHIGNDLVADYQMAKANGLHAFHSDVDPILLNCLKSERKLINYTGNFIDKLRVKSVWYDGCSLEQKIANYIYSPVLYVFAKWLVNECRRKKISNMFFVLREGDLISKIVCLIAPDLKVSTLFVSRRSSFLASNGWSIEVLYKLCERRDYTLNELFEDVGLEVPAEFSEQKTTPISILIRGESWFSINNYLEAQVDEILSYLGKQRSLLKKYVEQCGVSDSENIGIFDWGCGGSILENLNNVCNLDKVNYFMFYGSNKSITLNLKQKINIFQPARLQLWANRIATYPELHEIILNGNLESTRAYKLNEIGIVTPISVIRPYKNADLHDFFDIFKKTVLKWCFNALISEQAYEEISINDRCHAFSILYRLTFYPYKYEADLLKSLEIPLSCGESRALIDKNSICELSELFKTSDEAYSSLVKGDTVFSKKTWFPGLISLCFPHSMEFLGELFESESRENYFQSLLRNLKERCVSNITIYGAGEFGTSLMFFLQQNDILINFFVDRRASHVKFKVGEIDVLSLDEAISKGINKFCIGSKFYNEEIENSIIDAYDKKGIVVTIFNSTEVRCNNKGG